jgi:hypothetical protein
MFESMEYALLTIEKIYAYFLVFLGTKNNYCCYNVLTVVKIQITI